MHRAYISQGLLRANLTVPVSKPGTSRCTWDEVRVSGHGVWWRVMTSTLATVFGSSPYFDYYRYDIQSLFTSAAVGRSITHLNIDLLLVVMKMLNIDTPLSVTLDPRLTQGHAEITDLRKFNFYEDQEQRSVLEMLFLKGPELINVL